MLDDEVFAQIGIVMDLLESRNSLAEFFVHKSGDGCDMLHLENGDVLFLYRPFEGLDRIGRDSPNI